MCKNEAAISVADNNITIGAKTRGALVLKVSNTKIFVIKNISSSYGKRSYPYSASYFLSLGKYAKTFSINDY